ncbi:MAG TPA: SIMPL domain-containing protein [Candidatus Bilamarchaeaceae archaeon]|nr:SIMPL domain-containing protein [Candidatus Bilamarchaeaceae archaeon]
MAEQYVLDRGTVLLSVFAIVVLVAGATYMAAGMGQQLPMNGTGNATDMPKISVSGEATRQVAPDLLIMGIAVETEKKTASEADAENARMTAKLKGALLAAGVQESEIATSYYNTYPVYNDSCYYPPYPCRGDVCPMAAEGGYAGEEMAYADSGVAYADPYYIAPPYRRCEPEVIGYRTTHSLMVKTGRINGGGAIIDAVSAANASARFDYQYFSLKDETRIRHENELAATAAQSARGKAAGIASGLGASLGRIVDIQTNYYYPGPYYGYGAKDYAMAEATVSARADPVATEIFPQDLTLTSNIYVTFEISQ